MIKEESIIRLDDELLIPVSALDKVRAKIEDKMESSYGVYNSAYRKGLDKANAIIDKALKQEPYTDCISREAVKELYYKDGYIDFRKICELSPVNSQPKTGHWINIEDRTDWYDAAYKCSCCGREITTPYELKNNLYSDYPYCHCGARMLEPQERSDKE